MTHPRPYTVICGTCGNCACVEASDGDSAREEFAGAGWEQVERAEPGRYWGVCPACVVTEQSRQGSKATRRRAERRKRARVALRAALGGAA